MKSLIGICLLNEHTQLRPVQLTWDDELSPERCRSIASYADAVGPSIGLLDDAPEYVAWCQQAGLSVHAFSFLADKLPRGYSSFDELLDVYLRKMRVGAIFTDHPNLVFLYLQRKAVVWFAGISIRAIHAARSGYTRRQLPRRG